MRMIERFDGDTGRRLLIDALTKQKMVGGNTALAETLAGLVALRQLAPGEMLIAEDGVDNDIYLVLNGTLDVVVKGISVAERTTNDVVGEMAAIDPTMRRTASVFASTETLVAVLPEPQLSHIGAAYPGEFTFEVQRRSAREILHSESSILAVF